MTLQGTVGQMAASVDEGCYVHGEVWSETNRVAMTNFLTRAGYVGFEGMLEDVFNRVVALRRARVDRRGWGMMELESSGLR